MLELARASINFLIRSMSKLSQGCIWMWFAASSATVYAAPPSGVDKSKVQRLDSLVERAIVDWNVPGVAVSVVRDGKVIVSKGYGVRSLQTRKPMTGDTIFPIQSQTKAFTALTSVVLRDERKLDFDAPVSSYLSGFRMSTPVATQEVSLRDFLTHRSGLPSHGWVWLSDDRLSRAGLIKRMPYLSIVHPIRTRWRYSNLGYVIAAHAVERAAGVSWEDFTQTRIIQPLGMKRTTLARAKAEADPNRITGSELRDGKLVDIPMQGTTPLTNSTGGIYSTADDLTKWMLFQLGDGSVDGTRVVSKSSLTETHTPQMIADRPLPDQHLHSLGYGLGWFVETYRGTRLVEHPGGHRGVSSITGLFPEDELGISVFVNRNISELPFALLLDVADLIMGRPSLDWARTMRPKDEFDVASAVRPKKVDGQAKLSSQALASYIGTFAHAGYGSVLITLSKNQLVATVAGDSSPLDHLQSDLFVATAGSFGNSWEMWGALGGEPTTVGFVRDKLGSIAGLVIGGTAEGVTFTKHRGQ